MRMCVTVTARELWNCLATGAAEVKSHYLVGSVTCTAIWGVHTFQGYRLGSPSFSETFLFQNNNLKIFRWMFHSWWLVGETQLYILEKKHWSFTQKAFLRRDRLYWHRNYFANMMSLFFLHIKTIKFFSEKPLKQTAVTSHHHRPPSSWKMFPFSLRMHILANCSPWGGLYFYFF